MSLMLHFPPLNACLCLDFPGDINLHLIGSLELNSRMLPNHVALMEENKWCIVPLEISFGVVLKLSSMTLANCELWL